ncbi:MAG: methylmalonyl-CoA epimerase [Rubellimicrobium sp.]|nr:methylmalonyl-CoA epimerase [Rubellimicrobium sp.]
MPGRLAHIAVAVPDLDAALAHWRRLPGARAGVAHDLPGHGVRVAFVDMADSRIELVTPLGDDSPVAGYLSRNPAGGIHHICYEVADLDAACAGLAAQGARVLGAPRPGAHGRPVIFLHPRDFDGCLIELEQAP